jgi:hypothetical protein
MNKSCGLKIDSAGTTHGADENRQRFLEVEINDQPFSGTPWHAIAE